MVTCRKCGGNCDPGEIVGGICIECMEQERQMQIRHEHAVRIITSPWYQPNFMEVLNEKRTV